LDVGTVLKDFNAIIATNASTSSDIEGAAVIFGNFSGATIYSNPPANLPSGYGAINVYGNTSGNNININDGGSAYVGGVKGENINFNGGGKYIPTAPADGIDFAALKTLSVNLTKLTENSTLPTTGNNEVISATAASNGIAVFDVTAASLDAIPSYKIALNNDTTVIFNVSGTSVKFDANDESGVAGADNIIWNFYQATTVNLGTQIAGTVLAPLAAVTNNNQIDGDLIANSWVGSGELHDYGFDGTLPNSTTSGVPEPSTWAMMLVGFGGLGLAGYRRAKRKADAAVSTA
jgi:choice-of-anchor A domain-containing protein